MPSHASSTASGRPRPTDPTSRRLLSDARLGDASALGQLVSRYLPHLRRWAHGRLPQWARTMADTGDVVQDAVLRTLGRLHRFEPRGRGALAAYLREAVRNRIRDEHRRIVRHGKPEALPESVLNPAPSALDDIIAREADERYRAALARLRAADRELIVAHVELDYTHEQLACMLGRTRNAARMALRRAVGRLADQMRVP
jgi:RNA polymerase sigma-70 factor, ECF subfamily